jgi:hypothetical protein
MKIILFAVVVFLIVTSAQAFWPRHFGGGAAVVTSDLWIDPQGNLVTDPQGNNISWPN